MLKKLLNELKRKDHQRYLGGLDFFKYIGPGLLVTVGFIDPGNWASNFAAGSEFGYTLLWVVTLSTVMLIVLQHNVAHLGIVTGLCLSEAAEKYAPRWLSRPILGSAVLASISTSLAEILGGAIALQMLLGMPIVWGALITTVLVIILLFTNSYKRIERAIIGFVSVIGLSFLYELFLVDIDWNVAARSWVVPSIPEGSLLIIMSVLGAVVMPHNLFLHSEVVQSREYNKGDEHSIRRLLKYEFYDTLFSMGRVNQRVQHYEEIEFFSRSGINFLPDLGYFSFCNRTDVGSFRDILPYQLVAVFYGSFLPCAIGIGKIHGHVELLGYPFMLGELTAVVRGDGLQGLSLVWQQQPPHGSCHRLRFLPVLEPFHQQEVRAPFRQREDGVAVLVHDEVHLPVPETFAVGFRRTLVYAHTVTDVRGLGLMTV